MRLPSEILFRQSLQAVPMIGCFVGKLFFCYSAYNYYIYFVYFVFYIVLAFGWLLWYDYSV